MLMIYNEHLGEQDEGYTSGVELAASPSLEILGFSASETSVSLPNSMLNT